mgnify:CR=1 FL=1
MMIITSNPNKKGNKHNKIIAALIVGICVAYTERDAKLSSLD